MTRSYEALWLDKRAEVIYCFGGTQPDWNIRDNATLFESIWSLQTNAGNGASWREVIGPASARPSPRDTLGTFDGMFCSDNKMGYYLGGYISSLTSWRTSDFFPNRGLLRFDFQTLKLTNSSELGFEVALNALVNVAPFDVLIALGGGVTQAASPIDLHRINIFDKANQKWHFQIAEGDIPSPRDSYCAVGVQGHGHDSFEM